MTTSEIFSGIVLGLIALGVLFILLRGLGYIEWAWFWLMLPIFIGIVIYIVMLIIAVAQGLKF